MEFDTTLEANMPESVSVQVVLVVTQFKRSPSAGTDTGPTRVLEAVIAAAAPTVKVKALEALSNPIVPLVVLATPSVGVAVKEG